MYYLYQREREENGFLTEMNARGIGGREGADTCAWVEEFYAWYLDYEHC